MRNKERLLILIPNKLSLGVIHSQIIDFFEGISHSFDISYASEGNLKIEGVNVSVFNSTRELDTIIRSIRPNYAYLRSPIQNWRYNNTLKSNKVKIIYSFRALVHIESYYRNGNIISFIVIFLLEFYAYLKSDIIHSVTTTLKQELQKRFILQKPITIIPCICVAAENINKPNQKSEAYKFVYVGGSSKWQSINEMLSLYTSIKTEIDSSSLDIFSNDIEYFKEKLDHIPAKVSNSIRIRNLPRNILLKELRNYNYGFLIRENHLVNKVASPIKLYEYVAAGIIPVITPYVGDIPKNSKALEFVLIYDISKKNHFKLVTELKEKKHDYNHIIQSMKEFTGMYSIKNYENIFKSSIKNGKK